MNNLDIIDMNVEIWKDIPKYKKLYQASNWGRIKRKSGSFSCNKDRVLKPSVDKVNRHHVILCKNGIEKTHKVHRLILETFVGPCPPEMECRHLDGDSSNNRLDNLKWGTHNENIQDKFKHGTNICGEKCSNSKLNEEQVRIIRWLLNNSNLSQQHIAKIFGVSQQHISDIKNFKVWKHVK